VIQPRLKDWIVFRTLCCIHETKGTAPQGARAWPNSETSGIGVADGLMGRNREIEPHEVGAGKSAIPRSK
jgi:hypothetical protein